MASISLCSIPGKLPNSRAIAASQNDALLSGGGGCSKDFLAAAVTTVCNAWKQGVNTELPSFCIDTLIDALTKLKTAMSVVTQF